jgi:hypothetical protein
MLCKEQVIEMFNQQGTHAQEECQSQHMHV